PVTFQAYPLRDFDLESGIDKKSQKPKGSPQRMMKSMGKLIHHHYKRSPILLMLLFLLSLVIALIFIASSRRLASYLNMVSDTESHYPFPDLKNLVMVAGHSVYTSNCGKPEKEDSWYLASYQRHPGQAASFVSHIQKGVEIADEDNLSLLLFSGGETRKDAGPRSEAQSYWIVAESKEWFGNRGNVRERALTEEHARDSYENLLFSLCRFRELTGSYPRNVTVVGYDFKAERFVDLHRSAVRFPASRFRYYGTPSAPDSIEAALKGEAAVRDQFESDPYGCSGSLFRKKMKRDPFHRSVPYPKGCPEMAGLFGYCGASPYPGFLPW
ncbi:hypothetical protein M569_13398, partial [Genlisea aurea]